MIGDRQHFRPDTWLGQLLGRDAYQLVVDADLSTAMGEAESPARRAFEALKQQPVFIWCRIPAADVQTGRWLQSLGFYVVDTSLEFEKPVQPEPQFVGNCTVRRADASDCDRVSALARSTFDFTRFHLDPVIGNDVAGEIKASWAANYFSGNRGDDMLVAVADDQIVGFLQLLHAGAGRVIIDLIAVDRAHQRRGYARDLIASVEAQTGGGQILVGTQAANVASVRLYEKLGFRLNRALHVLHFHHLPDVGTTA